MYLKQDNNSAIDVPEFGNIDPSDLSAQSGNYIKISFCGFPAVAQWVKNLTAVAWVTGKKQV